MLISEEGEDGDDDAIMANDKIISCVELCSAMMKKQNNEQKAVRKIAGCTNPERGTITKMANKNDFKKLDDFKK